VCTTNAADPTADRTAACIRARLESLDSQLEVLAQADATVVERTESLIRD
jgi:hypothetical protein